MQIKLIFKRKVLHLTSFSKMKFSEVESVLLLFKSSRMRRESETGVWHHLRWHILTSTKDKFVPRPLLSCKHTFLLVTRFLAHAGNPETKVLSYLCWIYSCVFRQPSEEVFDLLYRRLPGQAWQNLLQPLWRHLELFLALLLDKMGSKEWRYMNAVCNNKKEQYLLFSGSLGVNLVINCLIDGREIGSQSLNCWSLRNVNVIIVLKVSQR